MPLNTSRLEHLAFERQRLQPGSGLGLGVVFALALLASSTSADPPRASVDDLHAGAWSRPLDVEQPEPTREAARAWRIAPELWTDYVGLRADGTQGGGLSAFTLLPLRLSNTFRLRAAYRFTWLDLYGPAKDGASGASTREETPWHQHDAYLGFGFGGAYAWLDLLGMALFPSDEHATIGQAVQLRLGRHFGVDAFEATLHGERGWNVQLAPRVFVWPVDWLGLRAGPRFTLDDQGNPGSVEAGATLAMGSFQLYIGGHAGTQRRPVSPTLPLVLTLDEDIPLGGSAALLFQIAPHWTVGLSSHLDKLASGPDRGSWTRFSTGLRWSPGALDGGNR